MPAQFI